MNGQGERPPFIDCGHCGASVRVLWRFSDGWTASGRCPSCNYMVLSYMIHDQADFADFLSAAAASFGQDSDASVRFHFGCR